MAYVPESNTFTKRIFLHRDLNLRNILLDKNFEVKISDFGFVHRQTFDGAMTIANAFTPYYAAPELLSGNDSYTQKVDSYYLGNLYWREKS